VVLTKPTNPLAQARVNTTDQLTYDTSGTKYQIKHVMYIDNSQTAQIQRELDRLPLLITSSLESVYILLGYPGPIEKPDSTPSVAFDKIVEVLGALSTFLGLNINTDDLTVETPERRLKHLRDIITRHWNRKRKSFIARQAAQLIGNLISCLQGCHWLKLLAFEFTRLGGGVHSIHRCLVATRRYPGYKYVHDHNRLCKPPPIDYRFENLEVSGSSAFSLPAL
jgi:hypothetical protein